mmetsp:Transcript_127346/g.179729  ORF Transcript_127346/g.179729 Transcript_127346/m.179729 type:complete len:147 (+) Transcript_127346:43-483(+)
MLYKMYMLQSTVFFLLWVAYFCLAETSFGLYFESSVSSNAKVAEVTIVMFRVLGMFAFIISGLLCTAAKVHTKGMNTAVGIGFMALGAFCLYLEFSGRGKAIGMQSTMGPIPVSGGLFWGVYNSMSGVCFLVGGPAAGEKDGKKKK